MSEPETTEDGRYIIVNGRRWRKADPDIPETLRAELVSELMAARRAVGAALKAGDKVAEKTARARVQDAKLALGERGRAWWLPLDDDALRMRLAAAIRALLRHRGGEKSMCPSEAARIARPAEWRDVMADVREVASELAEDGWLDVTKGGEPVDPDANGPVRLRQRT